MNGSFHGRRSVVDDLIIHVWWKQRLRMFHRFVDSLRCFQLIRTRQKVDRHCTAWVAIQTSKGVVILRTEFDSTDIFDSNNSTGCSLADYDVLELFSCDQATGGADCLSKLLIGGRGSAPNLSRRCL